MLGKKIAVVAIGGNFLSDGKSPTHEQMKRAYKAAELVKVFVKKDFNVVPRWEWNTSGS